MEKQHQTFQYWLDEFFNFYYQTFPVNATFIGKHEYDSALPDFSPSGLEKTVSRAKYLLETSQAFNDKTMSEAESLDLLTARGYLETQLWELGI